LLEDLSSLKAALLTNAISYQALAGGQIHCAAKKNESRQQETGVPVDAVIALCDI
jgi:hypothetical protein